MSSGETFGHMTALEFKIVLAQPEAVDVQYCIAAVKT